MKYTYQNLHGKNFFKFSVAKNVELTNAMSFLDLNCCDQCGVIQHTWNELNWDCDYEFNGKYQALCNHCFAKGDYKEVEND